MTIYHKISFYGCLALYRYIAVHDKNLFMEFNNQPEAFVITVEHKHLEYCFNSSPSEMLECVIIQKY